MSFLSHRMLAEWDTHLGGQSSLTLSRCGALPCDLGVTSSIWSSEVRRLGKDNTSPQWQPEPPPLVEHQPTEAQCQGWRARESGGRRTQSQVSASRRMKPPYTWCLTLTHFVIILDRNSWK